MNTTGILLLVLIVVVIAVGIILYLQRRRSDALKQKFGPEYQRTARKLGETARPVESERAARFEETPEASRPLDEDETVTSATHNQRAQ